MASPRESKSLQVGGKLQEFASDDSPVMRLVINQLSLLSRFTLVNNNNGAATKTDE